MPSKPAKVTRPWLPRRSEIPAAQRITLRERDPFYHTPRWKKESRQFRDEHPLCQPCLEIGLVHPSEITDHIIPKDLCPDPWDKSNWQAVCRKYHAAKGSRDKQQFKKTKQ
jgi:5-methylcytosine-specific restriction protein A